MVQPRIDNKKGAGLPRLCRNWVWMPVARSADVDQPPTHGRRGLGSRTITAESEQIANHRRRLCHEGQQTANGGSEGSMAAFRWHL